MGRRTGTAEDGGGDRRVVVVGGGIAGLYCARELAKRGGYHVQVLEATDRFGGRIETEILRDQDGVQEFRAEFGPMRFELPLQPLFADLCRDLAIDFASFPPPTVAEPPITFPLADDERNPRTDEPLDSLELLKLGVYRMFDQDPQVDGEGKVRLLSAGRKWLESLTDEDDSFESLRREATMAGTKQPLYKIGFWNALSLVLKPLAVLKIMNFGTFYHLMPENPNAVEWAIFWLRIFKLRDGEELSTIPEGVQTVTERLLSELDKNWRDQVELMPSHLVTAVRPTDSGSITVEAVRTSGERTFSADHVILALPREPLLALAGDFAPAVRADFRSVIAFPLLKVFFVTKTPPWWNEPRKTQQDAWLVPTRELHYFPRDELADYTMVLLYTDRPATVFWQSYLADPEVHQRAEINRNKENEELRQVLAGLMFGMHFAWADGLITRTKGRATFPAGHDVHEILEELGKLLDLPDDDPLVAELAARHPALAGWPKKILLKSDEVRQWQLDAIGDYAIRDWSRIPFGAGCHAWAPRAKSWEVRERLAAFGFASQENVKNLHVCGEAYSDYQGFIEGALRSATDAVEAIMDVAR